MPIYGDVFSERVGLWLNCFRLGGFYVVSIAFFCVVGRFLCDLYAIWIFLFVSNHNFTHTTETAEDIIEEQNLATRGTWGKIEEEESDEESEEESDEEEEEEEEGEGEGEEEEEEGEDGLLTPLPGSSLGTDTPDVLNLRKQSATDAVIISTLLSVVLSLIYLDHAS